MGTLTLISTGGGSGKGGRGVQERICFLSPWLHLTPSDAEPVGSIPFKLEPLNGVRGQVVAVGWGGAGGGVCG